MAYQEYANDPYRHDALPLALGWFSLALGAAELLAPRIVARTIGVPATSDTCSILRAYGVREIASGAAILAQPDKSAWLWARVGGDALDLATLGRAAQDEAADARRLFVAASAVMGVAVLDVLAARGNAERSEWQNLAAMRPDREQAVTVRASIDAVESAWAEWCASGRLGLSESYAVRFEPAPGARGTEMHVAGGGSKGQVREELRRFKQQLEAGEAPVSDGPGLWRAAQPEVHS